MKRKAPLSKALHRGSCIFLSALCAVTTWSCSGSEGVGGAPEQGSGGVSASGGSGASTSGGADSGGTSTGGSLEPSGGSGGFTATGGSGATGGGGDTGGALGTGGLPGTGGDDGSGGTSPAADVSKLGESVLATDGLTIVSYGGYLNGESFQQDGILTHDGVQYAAYWNTARHVVLAARTLPEGAWSRLELTDYANSANDAHNTISLGIVPGDGTIHLSFDHHDDNLNYRRSVPGLLNQEFSSWTEDDFGNVTDVLTSGALQSVTYPRFVTAPDGQSLLLSMRIGASGNGTARLFEYSAENGAWEDHGEYVDGASVDENPYFHGISFDPAGERLHFAWCDRATPDATTNHDLFYVYSDDRGATLRNTAGDLVSTTSEGPLVATSTAARAVEIGQNRGLINQEHMTVDRDGNVHVLLSHLPDEQGNDGNFTSARTKSVFFHYYLEPGGTWTRNPINASVIENFRGKLAISASGNAYAILPDLRIYGADRSANYANWRILAADEGRFFSDPLIDTARLKQEDVLTIFYPVRASSQIIALDYQLD